MVTSSIRKAGHLACKAPSTAAARAACPRPWGVTKQAIAGDPDNMAAHDARPPPETKTKGAPERQFVVPPLVPRHSRPLPHLVFGRGSGYGARMNADISEANRPERARRLALAGWLAVAVALLSFWWAGFSLLRAYQQTLYLTEPGSKTALPESTLRRLSPDQRLVLVNDAEGRAAVEHAQNLWARWPTSPVYFHNVLTVALANYTALGDTDAARYKALRAIVEKGRPLDPDNARLDWILAAKRMDQACAFKSTVGEAADAHGSTVRSEFVVNDRAALNDAMRLLTAGIAKPGYRRYSRELMAEREALLGPPRDLPQIIQRLTVAAGTSLPDVTVQRNLARGATAYGSLLLAEGHTNEAAAYLNAWKPLGLQLNEDAFTLVDVLMVGAIFKEAEVKVPELMRTAKGPAEAARVRGEITALTKPLREWQFQREQFASNPVTAQRLADCRKRSGILLAMLLPALGEVPAEAALQPSRLMDYLLLDHAVLAGVAALLTIGLLVVAVVGTLAARQAGRDAPPAIRAGTWRTAAATVLWTVVLPVAVYLIVTWLTPLGGRGLGLQRAWPKAVMQAGILMAVIVLGLQRRLTGWSTVGTIDGDAGAAHTARIGWRIQIWTLAVLAAVSLFPATWLYTTQAWGAVLALAPFLVLTVSALAAGGLAAWTWRSGTVRRLADGVVRTAAPAILALGLAVLVINFGARALLFWEERRLAAQETLLQVDADVGGFTTIEARVARDLRDGMLQAAAMLQVGRGLENKGPKVGVRRPVNSKR